MHHNLIAYVGRFGSGKSLALVSKAIELADKYKLIIVTNISFNMVAYHKYCKLMKFRFAPYTRIIQLDMSKACPSDFFRYPNSVVVFDESGIYLNARFWKDTGKDFLSTLFQLRHDNITLLCGFQFWEQVDKQLREVIQQVVLCSSIAPKDKKTGRPSLLGFWRHYYEPETYLKILAIQPSGIKQWMLAGRVEHQLLFLDILIARISVFIRSIRLFFRCCFIGDVPWILPAISLPTLSVFEIYNSFVPSRAASKIKFRPYLEWDENYDSSEKTDIFNVWN